MTTEQEFYDRFQTYMDKIIAENPVLATQLGDHRYDDQLGHFDPQTLDRQLAEMKAELEVIQAMDSSGFAVDAGIDYILAAHALKYFIRDSEVKRDEYRDPDTYLSIAFAGVFLLIMKDFAVLAEGKKNIIPAETPKLWAELALENTQMGSGIFAGLLPSLAPQAPEIEEQLNQACQAAVAAIQDYATWLESDVIPNAQGDFPVGKDYFETLLSENHMVDWDSDWLLERGYQLYDETLAEMEDLARQIDPQRSAKELVESIKDDHPSAEGLLDAYRAAMESARQFVIQNDLVTIPENETLKIIETPAFWRNQIPYAAYMQPGLLEEVQEGIFVVTPVNPDDPPEQQEEKLRGHGNDDLPITALHEAYPGHHLQLTVANLNKSLPRLMGGFLSTLLIEGWAFYCEEMMEQQGYINKPIQRLARLQAQLWRASRIIVDVSLHTGRMSHDEAVEFMVEKANLEPSDAKVEVDRYTKTPTQPMSYLMGKYEILQVVDEYRTAYPDHSLKQMHDAILEGGSLPPRLLRRRLFPDN
jgi:uncharacterized protein (DUF885 family)